MNSLEQRIDTLIGVTTNHSRRLDEQGKALQRVVAQRDGILALAIASGVVGLVGWFI